MSYMPALALALLGLGALPAAAVPMQAVITGTVSTGIDSAGTFADAGSSLLGAGFTLTYRYDTSLGVLGHSGTFSSLIPLESNPPLLNPPITYAGLTINGITQTLVANYDAYVFMDNRRPGNGVAYVIMGAERSIDTSDVYANGYLTFSVENDLGAFDLPFSLTDEVDATISGGQPGTFITGGFSFYFLDRINDQVLQDTHGAFSLDRLVITRLSDAPTPVPLPAGLPLLAGALGMLALRRKR